MEQIHKLRKHLHEPVRLRSLTHIAIIIVFLSFFFLPLYLLTSPYTKKSNIQSAEAAGKITLDLYPQHYSLFTDPQGWIQKLDDAYNALWDLVGKVPYNGAIIIFKETPSSQMGGALMYAGNPIRWNDNYVASMIGEINKTDLSFGPIHELSHDFDITPYSYYYIGSTPLINAEQWANFKLTYVADNLSSKYPTSTFYQSLVGNVPIGQFSKRYFEDIFAQEWLAASRSSDWRTMKSDAYTGLLYSLARKYGWDIFRRTFRDYLTITDPLPTDDLTKINLFVKFLSKNAGVDLKPTFISWGIPVKEYVVPPNPAPSGFIFCSLEYDTCKFNGTATVAFGADGKFYYGTYTNSVSCTWNVFGDPAWGVLKACYYKLNQPTPTPTPIPTQAPPVTSTVITPTPVTTVVNSSADSDGDGFTDQVELFVGTNPNKACITNPATEVDTTKPGNPSKTWPADLNTASSSALPSFNRINIQDITSFLAPIRRFNTLSGQANYDRRWDFDMNGVINIVDLTKLTTLKPPIYDGVRAFNGSPCPL